MTDEQQWTGVESASGDAVSDKREEQILQALIETPAGERIRMKCGAADLRSVIADLLPMLPYMVNDVDAERLADYHKIGSMPAIVKSVDYGATSLAECVEMAVERWYHRGRKDATTHAAARMRDKCVEKQQ